MAAAKGSTGRMELEGARTLTAFVGLGGPVRLSAGILAKQARFASRVQARRPVRAMTMVTSSAESTKLAISDVEGDAPLKFKPASTLSNIFSPFRFFFLWPGARLKRDSILSVDLFGALPDYNQSGPSFLSSGPRPPSLPALTQNLRLAAHDRRISSVYFRFPASAALAGCGYAKLTELARHMDYFRESGKKIRVYAEVFSEKELFLAAHADEVYLTPEASISLRGFKVSADFLRQALDKVGIYPDVQRIGEYKSAGDQLLRTTMSYAQRETLDAILDAQLEFYSSHLASVRGVAQEEVKQLLEIAPTRASELMNGGWITGIKYESEVLDILKREVLKSSDPSKETLAKKRLRFVNSAKYYRVKPKTLGIEGRTKIAIIRAVGPISSGKSRRTGSSTVGSDSLVAMINKARDDDSIKAVVLRCDSPGGSALASDIIWQAVRQLDEKKPVIASLGDVAASGGYYITMAARAMVCEKLTITGSIGVVVAKLSLGELFEKIGFNRTYLSRGKLAELDVDNRKMTDEEKAYFADSAQTAYKTFWSKACSSRNRILKESLGSQESELFEEENFEKLARGRVWTGIDAKQRQLVDAHGGLWSAVSLAKQAIGIDADDRVRLVEVRAPSSGGFLQAQLGLIAEAMMTSDQESSLPDLLQRASKMLSRPEVMTLSTLGADTSTNTLLEYWLAKLRK